MTLFNSAKETQRRASTLQSIMAAAINPEQHLFLNAPTDGGVSAAPEVFTHGTRKSYYLNYFSTSSQNTNTDPPADLTKAYKELQ